MNHQIVQSLQVLSIIGGVALNGTVIYDCCREQSPAGEVASDLLGLNSIESEFSLGRVRPQQEIEHEISVLNQTEHVWKIGRIDRSCGCLSAVAEQEVVLPGEPLVVRVEYRAPPAPGSKSTRFRVNLDGSPGSINVLLHAEVIPDVACGRNFIQCQWEIDEPVTGEFLVANYSDEDWSTLEARAEASWLSVTAEPTQCDGAPFEYASIPPKQLWRVCYSEDTSQRLLDSVIVEIRLQGRSSQKTGSVYADTVRLAIPSRHRLSVYPSPLFFGTIDVGKVAKRTASISVRSSVPISKGDISLQHQFAGKLSHQVLDICQRGKELQLVRLQLSLSPSDEQQFSDQPATLTVQNDAGEVFTTELKLSGASVRDAR